jgi:chitinase
VKRALTRLSLVLLSVVFFGSTRASALEPNDSPWVTAYYLGYFWDWHATPAEAVAAVDMTAMTHIVFARYAPGAGTRGGVAGQLVEGAGTGHVKVEQLLIDKAHANGVRAIMMIGGAKDGPGWVASTKTPALRAAFISAILAKVQAKRYDGVDVDWEDQLDTDAKRSQCLAFVSELRAAAPGLLITFPGYGINVNGGTVGPFKINVAAIVDQYNLMTYSQNFTTAGWCSWFFSALADASGCHPTSLTGSIGAYVKAGVPRSKLGIGIGLYGNSYRPPITGMRRSSPVKNTSLGDYVDTWARYYRGGAGGYPGFNMMSPGTKVNGQGQTIVVNYVWDAVARTGYFTYTPAVSWKGAPGQAAQKVSVLTLEDTRSIAEKGAWVRAGNAGGTIVWAINYGYVSPTVGNPPMAQIKSSFLVGQ